MATSEEIREERRAAARDRREMRMLLKRGGGSDAWGYVLFVAWVGALFYFVQHSDGTFWNVILAFLKACVWPALVMFNILGALGIH